MGFLIASLIRTALGSAVQRIDFGPNAGEAGRGEGVVSGASMWRLGALRAELLNMVGERLRHVFQRQGLWAHTQPDTLQLTKIGAGQQIANHYDRRDRWQEGIASIAWSELPTSECESRGEAWTLVMRRASPSAIEHKCRFPCRLARRMC